MAKETVRCAQSSIVGSVTCSSVEKSQRVVNAGRSGPIEGVFGKRVVFSREGNSPTDLPFLSYTTDLPSPLCTGFLRSP
jgi:hypothetical protein